MQLFQARRKVVNFKVEIRRNYQEKLFKQIRDEMIRTHTESNNQQVLQDNIYQLTKDAFQMFIHNRQRQVPAICVQNFRSIDLSLLNQLLVPMLNKQVTHQSTHAEKWFIDCTAPNNLKFMGKLSILPCPDVLRAFFRATVAAHRPTVQTFGNLGQSKELGKCLFNIVANQHSGELQIQKIYDRQNSGVSRNIAAFLQFWSSYIQNTRDEIKIQDFLQIMRTFKLQGQFKDLMLKRETLVFIKVILEHIRISQILQDLPRENAFRKMLSEQCRSFILFVKMKMPFVVKKAVEYKLIYFQIAQILVIMYQFNDQIPDLFYQCLFECQYLHTFVLYLLKDEQNPSQAIINQKTALRLINCVTTFNMFELFYLQGAISITKQLAHKTLLTSKVQQICAIILWNIIEHDKEQYLMKIFELVDYNQLLGQVEPGSQKDVYDLVIKIVEVYLTSAVICKKIFEGSEFVSILKTHRQEKDSDSQILYLSEVIQKGLDYFFEHFPKLVVQLHAILKNIDFEDKEAVLKKIEERFSLAVQEASI